MSSRSVASPTNQPNLPDAGLAAALPHSLPADSLFVCQSSPFFISLTFALSFLFFFSVLFSANPT
eukprot:m.53521 g.53521  ORF g.53521 m.53521 type:complete len:65 (-) comp6772_c0_seq2:653-847(-)